MPLIVISYRRVDSAAITGRIFDHLVARYGKNSVFMDIDNIPYGSDFREQIRKVLEKTTILLVVIGKQWFGPENHLTSRILSRKDVVRFEIQTAIQSNVSVIPILVDGASMPSAGELPKGITKFASLNALELESGADFGSHIERLFRSIDQLHSADLVDFVAPASGNLMPAAPVAPETIRSARGGLFMAYFSFALRSYPYYSLPDSRETQPRYCDLAKVGMLRHPLPFRCEPLSERLRATHECRFCS
jgi:hypothetical protein